MGTSEENDLVRAELRFVASLAAPLFWLLRNAKGEQSVKSGSLFFLDTGTRLFAVTAAHVVQECLNDTRSQMFVQSMMGSNGRVARPIHLGDRIIDAHPQLDIATFHVTREEAEHTGCTVLTGLQPTWPPRRAELNCGVAYCGYTRAGRQWRAPQHVVFGCTPMGGIVTSVHESAISIQIERQNMMRVPGDEDMPKHVDFGGENFDFGGMSGGPLLVRVERGSLLGWAPAGVVFEGPNPSGDQTQSIEGLQIIKARPIDFINSDGTLDCARWDNAHF